MKIAIYVHGLSGGGAERVAVLWAKGFVQRNCSVNIIVNETSEKDYVLPDNVGLTVISIDNSKKRIRQIQQVFALRRAFKLFKPDVIITVIHPCGLYAYLSSIGLRIPIVNTEHNAFEWPNEASRYLPRLHHFHKYYTNRLFDAVTVLTNADKQLIENKVNKNVFVLPNPLTFEPVKIMPSKQEFVLAVGRLGGWYVKGFDLLIESWSEICQSYPNWILQIAGDGKSKDLNKLRDIVNEYNIADRVEFLGHCSNMQEIYQKASIFVLSSRYEGFGMVLVEAMSQGCACVACDWKGRQKDIIESFEYGLLCEPNDKESLKKNLMKLLCDEELRKQIQKNSPKMAEKYQLDNIIDLWEKIFIRISRR